MNLRECPSCIYEPKPPYNERRAYCLYHRLIRAYHGEQARLSTMDYLNGDHNCPYYEYKPWRYVNQIKPNKPPVIVWTCSDKTHHQHRWKWSAWACGTIQRLLARRVK